MTQYWYRKPRPAHAPERERLQDSNSEGLSTGLDVGNSVTAYSLTPLREWRNRWFRGQRKTVTEVTAGVIHPGDRSARDGAGHRASH